MRAIIDLGTNTFHLLIATVENGTIHEYYQEQIPVKIGAGGILSGVITDSAWKRGMNALEKFQGIIQSHKVETIRATGTSAIRNAKNGPDFLEEIKSRFGFEVAFITGDREAELIYLGVRHSFSMPPEPVLVMDIGGGSVEFIIGQQETIYWKHSFEMGAARLLEKFNPSDPMTTDEITSVEAYLFESLKPLAVAIQTHQPKMMIGSAGSFETLLDVLKQERGKLPSKVSRYVHEPNPADIPLFFELIIPSTFEKRRQLKGLVDFRVDMIVMASLLIRHVLDRFGMSCLLVSKYALKEGLLLSE